MRELKQIIDKTYNEGKLPYGLTPMEFCVLEYLYTSLTEKHQFEFTQSAILPILNRCKIKYKTRGIGWIAYR